MFSFQKLFGKDDVFYNLLEASAAEAQASAQTLSRLLRSPKDKPALQEFMASRRKDKAITNEIGEKLIKAFVTALEREDIESLSSALYKVPKTIEKFAERYLLASQQVQDWDFSRPANMLEQATAHVTEMVKALRRNAHLDEIKDINGRLQQLEGDADKYILDVLADLYSGKYDPIKVVALKDLHELLERAMDRCRDAGNVVSYIILKHS